MNKPILQLRNLYLAAFLILFSLIIATPHLIRDGISIFTEEVVESIVIAILFLISFILYAFYQREMKKNTEQLNAITKHVGTVNLQIERFKSSLHDIEKYPKTKSDLRSAFSEMSEDILGIVPCNTVFFRIIDIENIKTLTEYSQQRPPQNTDKTLLKIGNKELIENSHLPGHTMIASGQKNLNIQTFCILDIEKISHDQATFLQKKINDLEMLFIIFTSIYYKHPQEIIHPTE